jgi:hypothetical protein
MLHVPVCRRESDDVVFEHSVADKAEQTVFRFGVERFRGKIATLSAANHFAM